MSAGSPFLWGVDMDMGDPFSRYRAMRRKETLMKARSFREYLQMYINFLSVDVCAKFGIMGCHIVDYQAFAKKVTKDFYSMILESTVDPRSISIDDIFDYYEKTWVKPRKLRLDIVKAMEEELLKLFNNIDKVRAEYETMLAA